jgi:hypothetical protein
VFQIENIHHVIIVWFGLKENQLNELPLDHLISFRSQFLNLWKITFHESISFDIFAIACAFSSLI